VWQWHFRRPRWRHHTRLLLLLLPAQGLASTLSQGPALPALHVTAALLLAALMGAFNTQTFLDLDNRCNIQQAAIVGCSACPCAATNSCTEKDLATDDAACASCRALGTDLCMRVRWLPLLMPFTGLIEAVVLALPAFLSLLLLLLQRGGNGSGGAPMAVVDAGGQGAAQGSDNVKCVPVAGAQHCGCGCGRGLGGAAACSLQVLLLPLPSPGCW
jgi:hypothetical protein